MPSARTYEPGTNTLLTSWRTQTGWAVVRDALTMGPRSGEGRVTPHTRPPSDEDAQHVLVRTVTCLDGEVEIDLVCEPAFDYGRAPADWTLTDDRHSADAAGAGQTVLAPIPICCWGSRKTAPVHGTCWSRASSRFAPSPGPRGWPDRRPSNKPAPNWKATTRYLAPVGEQGR